ncbi:MAG TPA: endonuclease VII domain-containing protein [Pseudolabrys sp.]|nr:endonuclease VII domain-containing protein [Pseudolabrys sp.]
MRKYGRYEKIRGIDKGKCSVDDCKNAAHIKGLCPTHYQRQQKYGRFYKVSGLGKRKHPYYALWFERKQAGALCDEWEDFWRFVEGIGHKPGPNWFLVRLHDAPYGPNNFKWVEKLRRAPGETRKQFWARKWVSRRKNFPLYEEDRWLRRRYGINLEQYNAMLAAQNGVCAICKKSETSFDAKTGGIRRLSVDHCHRTKKVRSLLCFRCNSVIGRIEESQEMVKALSEYLLKHRKEF